MTRIMIIGGSGAGKTTLARKISAATELPVYHLDTLIFYDNWKAHPGSKILAGIDKIINTENWVFEGSFAPAFDRQLLRVDTVIFLDIPTHIRLWRAISRGVRNFGKSLPEHDDDCKMRLRWWLIKLVVRYHFFGRKLALALMKKLPNNVRAVHIKSQKHIDEFMATL